MENNVPYIAYESAQARSERHIRRMLAALIVAVVLMFLSNALWLWAWVQYDYTSETTTTETTYQQDGQGLNIIGDSNNVTDQARESNHPAQNPNEESD